MNEEFLWVEKYRPKTVDEMVLPQHLRNIFLQFLNQKNIPNLLLTGTAGVGKTTVAKAMLEELDCDYIVINGSMNGNIDTLRNEILNFASAVSFTGGRKYVILDEADYLNPNSTQPALRSFMEEFSSNCGFILTCNYLNKIITPLQSRCSVIDFNINNKEKPKFAAMFFNIVCNMLDKEKVTYDKPVVAEVINKHFPDCRRIINELQRYSATGAIDSGILSNLRETSIRMLIEYIKDKNFTEARKWAAENVDSNVNDLFRQFYDSSVDYVKPQFVPALVMLIGEYQYKAAFAADQEINFMAFVARLMIEGIYA